MNQFSSWPAGQSSWNTAVTAYIRVGIRVRVNTVTVRVGLGLGKIISSFQGGRQMSRQMS